MLIYLHKMLRHFSSLVVLLCLVFSNQILANIEPEAKIMEVGEQKAEENPLLQDSILPKYNLIKPQHFKPAIIKGIEENKAVIEKLLIQKKYTWNNFISPLEEANEKLRLIWATIEHLNQVIGNDEVRKSYEECIPLITKYQTETTQNERLYNALNLISASQEHESLNQTQKKILNDKLRDFRLNGVNLPPNKKEHFIYLQQRLAELSSNFANNVADATQSYTINLTEKEVSSLPEASILLDKKNAKKKNQDELIFTLDLPSYDALVYSFAYSRSLREKTTIAYLTRASDKSLDKKWDNSKIIEEILAIRKEIAKMLSFKNFAEYSLTCKMAKSAKRVTDFLYALAEKCRPKSQEELKELQELAKEDGINQLEPWDLGLPYGHLGYYGEKLKYKKFKITSEELSEYFPLPHVLNGLFEIIKRLYDVTLKENSAIPVWHEDVRVFEIYDHENNLLGYIYLDLYLRKYKSKNAWMEDAYKRYISQDGKLRLPATYLMCDFSPPVNGKPSLLSHDELLVLLHEMGHCLQYLLTKVDYLGASCLDGIPLDGMEVASLFMENYGWQKESLKLLSRHYKNGKPLPEPMLKKLLDMRTFQTGLRTLRLIELSLVDLKIHQEQAMTMDKIEKIISRIQKEIRIIPIYKDDRLLHAFLHLFVGGYEVGYYGYLWGDIISSDLFSKFEKYGIFNQNLGREFLHKFLELGGSEDPEVLHKRFLGRETQMDAFLRHNGLSNTEPPLKTIKSQSNNLQKDRHNIEL